MKRLTSIVALNAEGAIGCQNELPWRLKTDMRFFRRQTMGQVVIMGRKTLDSIGNPLSGRHNIVLSHNSVLFQETDYSQVATSIVEALVFADKKKNKEVFIVGGSSTYEQFSPFVDRYFITIVNKKVPHADAFFNEKMLGNEEDWLWEKLEGICWDPSIDEVEFEVFEVSHVRPAEVGTRRAEAIADHKARYLNRGKSAKQTGPLHGSAVMQLQFR